MLLDERILDGDKLQKQLRMRLAGIPKKDSIIAIRHSDQGRPKYEYYLDTVLKVAGASSCNNTPCHGSNMQAAARPPQLAGDGTRLVPALCCACTETSTNGWSAGHCPARHRRIRRLRSAAWC